MIGRTIAQYEILGELGAGGMGEVYLARDSELERKIALKVLPEDLASDSDRLERFRREARTLAGLNHPNIVTIFSVEEKEGIHFLTMELVEGKTLSSLITSGGSSLERIFEIAVPLADALAAAHDKGVVHRDLKPGNIMVTEEGRVKVLDFGLAKLSQDSLDQNVTELATEALTGEGVIVGTVPYMSPEQLEGKTIDARSDIFSLGVILYEMATGERPFQGESSVSLMSSILKDTPREVEARRGDLPRHLSRVIRQCLDKNPDRRIQSARDVRNQIETLRGETISEETRATTLPPKQPRSRMSWVATGVSALLVLGLGGWLLWRGLAPSTENITDARASAVTAPSRSMIVVLPFENLGDAEDEYFADGMTEEITSRLASLDGLGVISRTSAMQYKDERPSLRQIGEELGVDHVLEGTVRWQRSSSGPSRVRVTPQLIRVSDDTHLWAERYDAVLEDIFEVQSDIAKQVSEELGLALLEPELRSLEARPTESLEAYDAYLRANDYHHRGLELNSLEQTQIAIEMYDEAVRLDPTFALATARQAVAHGWLYFMYLDHTDARLALAKEAVERALELDPELPEAHHALGLIYYSAEGDVERGLEEFQFAVRSQPNNAELLELISFAQTDLGRWEEGRASVKQAIELNPRLGRLPCWAGGMSLALRDFDEAARLHESAIRLTPDRSCPYVCMLEIYLNQDGSTARARRFLDQIPGNVDLEDNPAINYVWVMADMMDGRLQDALARLESGTSQAYELVRSFYIPKAQLSAQIYGLLKQPELEKAQWEAARDLLEEKLEESSEDSRIHGALGIAYAGLGRRQDAIREGKLGLELIGGTQGELLSYRLRDLAQIYVILGDYDHAIDHLEHLLSIPSYFSAPYLNADRTWAPLRDHPRFQAVLAKIRLEKSS